ncbi:MAG TPA: cyclase family protein [Dehalococcoidia bacterium]|jgi:kynurenine formamidase
MDLPAYDALEKTEGGARSAWRLFGEEDCLGLMNLQTPERVLGAAKLIRNGKVFSLNAPLDYPSPPLYNRGAVRRTNLSTRGGRGFDDVLDNFFPQAASQWDSLGHVGFKDDTFYNGASWEDVNSGRRNTIEHWARKGIAGRAVLLDVRRATAEAGQPYDPGSSHEITVEELELTRERAGVTFQPGDIVLLRTGFTEWYLQQDLQTRRRIASPMLLQAPGIAHSEAMARYVWESHASGWAADCPSLEAWPPQLAPEAWPFGFLHNVLIGQFGLAIGELWWLEELAADCAADGVYEMFVTSAPLNSPGGIGSPPNALAIK